MSDSSDKTPANLSKLVWKDERSNIQEHVLNKAISTYIGRDTGNNIILVNPKVSKRHAELHWSEDHFLIADQGSANGTLVNGKVITSPTPLKDGDRVEIGDYVLSYYLSEKKTIEELKTRPLEELGKDAGKPDSELKTQILPGPSEKTPVVDIRTEEKALDISDDIAPSTFQGKPAESAVSTKGEPVMDIDIKREVISDQLQDAFTELLKSISSAQSSGNILKNKGLTVKTALEAAIDQLQIISGEMQSLEEEAVTEGISDMLKKLTATPNDVTLLMDLSRHTGLLGKIIRDYSVQAAVIDKIKTKLESDLKSYIS